MLRADFDRAIPAGKHLERRELIHLLNDLWTRNEYGGILGLFADDLTRTARRTLWRHHYSGFGDPGGVGMVIVNPSALRLRTVFVYDEDGGALAPIRPHALARLAARSLITLARPSAERDAEARPTGTAAAATQRLSSACASSATATTSSSTPTSPMRSTASYRIAHLRRAAGTTATYARRA